MMMKNTVLKCFALLLFFPLTLTAQNGDDPVVVAIDKHNITKSEFLRVYQKNNSQAGTDLKSLNDYMDLFVNFKLKVVEAEHLGYDTVSSFLTEYKSYRDQLAKPYFIDTVTDNRLMHEAYDRMLWELHARQIYIRVLETATPADTLNAYNKAMEARAKILAGVPWDTICFNYSNPDMRKTNCDMNYFTAFQTIYKFENEAYKLKVNEVSMPIRTYIGYHVVQVLDRRTAHGELKVAHIMAAFPENAKANTIDSAKIKIYEVYKKLQAGEKFEDLAKTYSDDKRSATRNGELNWFGTGQMIPEFERAAFSIAKDGEYSSPMRTSFGWHIIKRLAARPISSYDNLKDYLKQKIARDERANFGREAIISRIKKEVKFTDHPEKVKLLYTVLDSSYFKGNKWPASKAEKFKNELLFSLNNISYSVYDLAEFMVLKNKGKKPVAFSALCGFMYKDFVDDKIVEFENSRLDQKYPEYKFLLQEYHDGILLFNLMEEKIWNAAARDSVGLEKYYKEHASVYKWGDRVNSLVVTSPKKDLVDLAYTKAKDYADGKVTVNDMLKLICKDDTTLSCMNISEVLFEKGDNVILDSLGWEKGITPIVFKENKYGFFVKKETKPACPKTYDDAKGTVIADYQAFLEQLYVAELKKKYKVTVNDKVLESISKTGK